MKAKDRAKAKRPKSSIRISNTWPRWSLSHNSPLTGNGGIKVCSCESWERSFCVFICSSVSVKYVELYYAKRLEDIGVILGIVFRQITSQLSVSSRTLVLSRSRHVKATGWQCREWEMQSARLLDINRKIGQCRHMDVRRLADSAPAFLLKVCLEWQLMGWELRGNYFIRRSCVNIACVCVVCVWEHIRPISLKKLQQQRKCCILLLAIYLSHCMLHASISIKHNCNLI